MHKHPEIEICVFCQSWSEDTRVLAAHVSRLENTVGRLVDLVTTLETSMTQFGSDQQHLDADVQALAASLQGLEDEVASLKAQPGADALDFTGLDALVTRIQSDLPSTPVADPAPVDTTPPASDPVPVDVPPVEGAVSDVV